MDPALITIPKILLKHLTDRHSITYEVTENVKEGERLKLTLYRNMTPNNKEQCFIYLKWSEYYTFKK
jgi:hypothetical protein